MDESKGRLLSDKVQTIFTNKMAQAGIVPTECSVLSVVQERHPRIDNIALEELYCWEELLRRDLASISPNVIIAVGELPLRVLTNYSGIDLYKGSPLECKLQRATVVPVEDYINYYGSPAWQPLTDFYLQKAESYSHSPELPYTEPEIIVTTDLERLEAEFLAPDYLAAPNSVLAIDIESSVFADNATEMTCIGFAKDESRAFVLPIIHMASHELAPALKLIDRIQRSPVRKILQNGSFDITYQGWHYGVKVNNFWWDTMLAGHALFPNLPKGLDTLASIYTDQPHWKTSGKQWKLPYQQVDWDQFFRYNGKDTANLITIQKAQAELLEARGTMATLQQEMDLCYPLVAMELEGMKINPAKQAELQAEAAEHIRRWDLYLQTLLDDIYCNVASPKQLQQLLYKDLKLPTRVRGGKVSVDIDALTSLIPFAPEIMKPIVLLKQWKKENSEYKVKLINGRMHANFKPAGTITGRLSSSKSILGTGTNFQNRSKKLRVFFEPDDGKVLLQADYSKAESWVVAALAQDEKMLAALHAEDFHSENASNLLGKKVTKENYTDRQLGKRVSHSANYGATAFLLQKVLLKDGYTFTKYETQQLLDDYFMAYPLVHQNFHEWVKKQLQNGRTLTSPFGRKVTFWEHWNNTLFNAAFAWIPQSTVGDMTNKALINIYHNIPEVDLRVQVHDSVVMQLNPSDLTQSLIDRISEQMIIPLTIKGTEIKIPIDVEIGPNWKDLTDWNKIGEAGLPDFLKSECGLSL